MHGFRREGSTTVLLSPHAAAGSLLYQD
jgi:hypothetical protein